MIDVNDLRKGVNFTLDGELFKVLDYQHNKTGRGNATIRTTLRTCAQVRRFRRRLSRRSGAGCRLESREVEYLYTDDQFLTFMDLETYEQPIIRRDTFGDDLKYLREGLQLKLLKYEEEIIDYELPNSIVYEVTDSEIAVAGDTATGATKKITLETASRSPSRCSSPWATRSRSTPRRRVHHPRLGHGPHQQPGSRHRAGFLVFSAD
jgi:elongation factor P